MTSNEGIFEPMVPAPREPPPAEAIRHAELGQAWRCEVFRDAAGRPLLALVEFEGGQALPLLFGRRGGWGWWLLSVPAGTTAPDRPGQPDHEEGLKSFTWEEILGEVAPLDDFTPSP